MKSRITAIVAMTLSMVGFTLIWLVLAAGDGLIAGIVGGAMFGGGVATGLWGRW